jgi:NAD(P)-dependent dehydrogenase (short-subunit alcohol dehydrogenase family)
MKIDLSGRRAVISGSTAGIGFAIAKGLAEAGAAVVINGRQESAVKDAVKQLTQAVAGAKADGVAADLACGRRTGAASCSSRANRR